MANQFISPADLLRNAEEEADAEPYYALKLYAPAFYVLNRKGMTWTAIHQWAIAHGIDRQKQSIVNAVREYAREQGLELL